MSFRRLQILSLLCVLVAACSDAPREATGSDHGGTVVIAATGDPDALFPPAARSSEARQVMELVYEYLADVGPSLNTIGDEGFVKELAVDWSWGPDSLSIAFRVHPDARWHDGKRVTAGDVAFSWSVYSDTAVAWSDAQSLEGIDSVTVRDSATAVVWFSRKSPRQFYDAAATMLILPSHVLGGIRRDSLRHATSTMEPVGSGRYRFVRWTHRSSVELAATETHHREPARIARVIWSVSPEAQSSVTRLLAGEADVLEFVKRENIAQLSSAFNISMLPGMDYAFMQLNLRDPQRPSSPHPLFQSRELRRALTMALDRPSMVINVFDTLARVSQGPMIRAWQVTDTTVAPIAFDRVGAERLLDSMGWRRGGPDAIRTRDGRKLSFTCLVPSSSAGRTRMSVLIQEQLRRVGVEIKLENMDNPAMQERQQKRDFDALLGAWKMGSSPGAVRLAWTGNAGARDNGLNYGRYANPVFDALVDSALSANTVSEARAHFRKANQIIVDDAPAIWLYEPRTVLAVHKRIRTTRMRPNAWWLDIGSWEIPARERLPRDAAVVSAR